MRRLPFLFLVALCGCGGGGSSPSRPVPAVEGRLTFGNAFDGDSSPLENRVGYGVRNEDDPTGRGLVFFVYGFDESGSPVFDGREVRIYVDWRDLRPGKVLDLAAGDAEVDYNEYDRPGAPYWVSVGGKVTVLGVQGDDPLTAQIRLENVRLVPAVELGLTPGTRLSGSIEIHTGAAPV